MPDRLYNLSYPDNPKRPIYIDDAGNLLQISGLLVQGMGANILFVYPGMSWVNLAEHLDEMQIYKPTLEEWCAFLAHSDDPLVFQEDETGTVKAIIRKAQRVISGAIQQRIWHRDGYQCMYCGKEIPEVQLTVDHFIPLELGGIDDQDNYLSCCRLCNKKKGNIDPKIYCEKNDLDYEGLKDYLSGKASKLFINHLQKNLDRF